MIMVGSFFGVIFNETMPEGVLVIILISVILFSILSGLSKTLENYRRETELFEQWDMEDKGTVPEDSSPVNKAKSVASLAISSVIERKLARLGSYDYGIDAVGELQ